AVFHVLLECLSLSRRVRARVQEQDHSGRGEKLQIEVVPVCRGLKREAVLGGHPGKPRPRFVHKADVRGIRLAGIESNDPESWWRRLAEGGRNPQTGRENGDPARLEYHRSTPHRV